MATILSKIPCKLLKNKDRKMNGLYFNKISDNDNFSKKNFAGYNLDFLHIISM